ncbi:MAG: aminotransferase class V-fold PLP-dependent enzyme [Heliobacteriaceae bacterium]|nr:aminotransferase class V-fold PLP-dependent enzyme [Heliobacteriaceae bacterium]MDD4588520.1 aminotransferase class V-fold PLP-dependent enzyme [Heliobacteriaceae bacterium]
MIYLDNAATSYPKPEGVYSAVDHFNRHWGGNPGRGSSRNTQKADQVVFETRNALARLFNIKAASRIVFSLNITEAINLGLKGLLQPGDHVITTSMEHNAVARPLHRLQAQGVSWTKVQCGPDGSLDPDAIEVAIRPNSRLICMLHASNLTGTIMPVGQVGQIARQHGLVFMVDSAQTAGVLPLDVEAQAIDLLAFTGHKGLLGPQGTGGLYIGPNLSLNPLKEGGTGSLSATLEQPEFLPDRLESGTPNTPGLAGLGAAVKFIQATGQANIRQHEQRLTAKLLAGLEAIPGVHIYGPCDSEKRTAVVAFNIATMDCGEIATILDYEFGIITRAGLHCAPLAHQTIGTLQPGACRLSPGFFTNPAEIDAVVAAVEQVALAGR